MLSSSLPKLDSLTERLRAHAESFLQGIPAIGPTTKRSRASLSEAELRQRKLEIQQALLYIDAQYALLLGQRSEAAKSAARGENQGDVSNNGTVNEIESNGSIKNAVDKNGLEINVEKQVRALDRMADRLQEEDDHIETCLLGE